MVLKSSILPSFLPSSFLSLPSFLIFLLSFYFLPLLPTSLSLSYCLLSIPLLSCPSFLPFLPSLPSPFLPVLPPDDIAGPQPGPFLVSVMGASLQSLPLPLPPPPPPSHATIQHSLSLNGKTCRAGKSARLLPANECGVNEANRVNNQWNIFVPTCLSLSNGLMGKVVLI